MLARVPLGTPSQEALKTLTEGGLNCRIEIVELSYTESDERVFCRRSRWAWRVLIGNEEWSISAWLTDGVVREIRVVYGVTVF